MADGKRPRRQPPHLGTPAGEPEAALWQMEEALWTSGRDSARSVTPAGAILVLPYPDGILQGDASRGRPVVDTGWHTVGLTERSALRHGDVVILAYRVRAEKPGIAIHEALCASTWLRDAGTWQRLSHQQTPAS